MGVCPRSWRRPATRKRVVLLGVLTAMATLLLHGDNRLRAGVYLQQLRGGGVPTRPLGAGGLQNDSGGAAALAERGAATHADAAGEMAPIRRARAAPRQPRGRRRSPRQQAASRGARLVGVCPPARARRSMTWAATGWCAAQSPRATVSVRAGGARTPRLLPQRVHLRARLPRRPRVAAATVGAVPEHRC